MTPARETLLNDPPEAAAARHRVEVVPSPGAFEASAAEEERTGDIPDFDLGSGSRPRVVGQYRLLERIGEGAMGEVYRAEHVGLGRSVALKLLRPELSARRDCAQRLFAEARAANRVRSDHVVEVTDLCFEPSGETFLVMELLEGQDLAAARDEGRLDLQSALEIMRQLTETLAEVHRADIVHRDLKPENVFLTERNGEVFVKLIDFGVAKLDDRRGGRPLTATSPGMIVGTPHYMAPEQAAADPVDAACDVYAIGVMLYEILAGRRPYEASTMRELLMDIVATVPPPLSAHVRLPGPIARSADELLAACLQKDASRRPTAERVLQGIDRLLADLTGQRRTAVPRFTGPPASHLPAAAHEMEAGSQAAASRAPTGRWRRHERLKWPPYRVAVAVGLGLAVLVAGLGIEHAALEPQAVDQSPGLNLAAAPEPASSEQAEPPALPVQPPRPTDPVPPPSPEPDRPKAESQTVDPQRVEARQPGDDHEGRPEPESASASRDRRESEHRGRQAAEAGPDEVDAKGGAEERREARRARASEAGREKRQRRSVREDRSPPAPTLSYRNGAGPRDAVMNPFDEE